MERQKKIVDASVIVKWFAEEEWSNAAIELKNKHVLEEVILVVPEFTFLEVINALRYKKLDEESLKKSNQDLWDMQLEIVQLNKDLIDKIVKSSLKYDLSIYDAIYATLAEINNVQLITADDKLSKTPNAVALSSL